MTTTKTFVRKAFNERVKGLPDDSPERESFEQDHERIRQYLDNEVNKSSKGLAIFACAGASLFEAIQVDAPFDQHWVFVGSVPHLYVHQSHIKEVVDTLDKLVRDEDLHHIVIAGEEVALSILRLNTSLDALHEKDAETDAERVRELLSAWRSGGLGVAGPEATMRALQLGQVDELIITSTADGLKPIQKLPDDAAPGTVQADTSAPQGAATKGASSSRTSS